MATTAHDLIEDVGELLLVGFEGTALTESLQAALSNGHVGGVILFARNIESIEQVVALNRSIHEASSRRIPFVAIDQEGGPVQRIKHPLPTWPAMRVLGELGDSDLCARVGEAMGDELAELGFNLNFAPCADVDSNPMNPIIGPRAFSDDPALAGRYAGAYAAGLTISGVIPCAKHFPGHGDTNSDSHLELPRISKSLEELEACELIPFRALIRTQIPMIMTAHILFEALDSELPATLSPTIISELLRIKMGYDGVVVSDDLEMNAVAEHFSIEEMLERGLRSGVDIFLICRSEEKSRQAFEALMKLGKADALMRSRIREAATRVRALRSTWLRPWAIAAEPIEAMNLDQHHALLVEIEEKHQRTVS